MGQLKPGATYIYERVEDTVYQREAGADPSTRVEIGYDYDTHEERRDADIRAGMKKRRDQMMEDKLWDAIRKAARTNPTLQDALDRAIIIYNLTKTK
jgi:DTW domain-containing protein YfiP